MSGEEQTPSGGGYRKPIDPKKLKQMKERWKQSESIRGLSNKHHQEHEVPIAEEELLKDLEKINPIPKQVRDESSPAQAEAHSDGKSENNQKKS